MSPREVANIVTDVEQEAVIVEEAEDGDEDDDISVEDLSALLPAGRPASLSRG